VANSDLVDVRGLAVTAPAAAIGKFDALVDDLYYYRPGVVDRVVNLLDDFPDFSLAHVLVGYSLMTEGSIDAHPEARARLQLAEMLPANRRERLHQEALRAWLDGDALARAATWERILLEWPHDLLAFRQYTGTLFWVGDKTYQAEVVAGQAGYWNAQIPGYGHFLSAMSFAMEEVGNYEVAEKAAREALNIEHEDLWALHGLAHVLEMQGRTEEGIELLEDAARFLNDYNLFRGHLWWHLSLFKLTRGRFDEVLDLFDREIYPKESTFYLDIQNGSPGWSSRGSMSARSAGSDSHEPP
jgi:tetratricopeptide (TPR) repeat protein